MSGEGPAVYRPPPGSIPTLAVPDATGWRRVHMVGVGGAGMSGLARLLLARGVAVSGSDLKASRVVDALADAEPPPHAAPARANGTAETTARTASADLERACMAAG